MNKSHTQSSAMLPNSSSARRRKSTRLVLVLLLVAFTLAGYHFLSTPPVVRAVDSPGVAASQVEDDGGNSVAIFRWNHVGLYNRGTSTAPLSAYSIGGSVDTYLNESVFQSHAAGPRILMPAAGSVAFDSSAKGCFFTPLIPAIPPVTTFTWNHTIGSDTNRALIVGVSTSYETLPLGLPANRVQSVTYNAQPLTRIGSIVNTTDRRVAVELFRLKETEGTAALPAAGTYPVVVTLIASPAAPDYAVGGSASFSNVNQITPNRTAQTAQGNSTTPALNVTSATDELVIDTVGTTFAAQTLLAGAGQTERWNGIEAPDCFGGISSVGAGSTEPGAPATEMSWSISASAQPWALVAAALLPAPETPDPNTAPVAVAPTPAPTTNEDTAVTITLTGTDAENNALTFTITDPPDNGSLGPINSLDCSQANTCTAQVTYTPAANYFGADSFSFKVNDGTADSSDAIVNITVNAVNDAPSFTAGPNQLVNEDSAPVSTAWATGISSGPNESDTLDFIVVNDNNDLFSVQPAIDPSGVLTYTVAQDANGIANVTVTLHDNGGTANGGQDTSAPQMFTITVTAVNDAPVNGVPGAQVTDEDTPLVFSSANSNQISISDVDAGTNPVQVTLTATNGTVTITTSGLSFTTGAGTDDAVMTFTGTITDINAALDGLTFTPNASFDGPASLRIVTNDQGYTGTGGAKSDDDTVAITVTDTTGAFTAFVVTKNADTNDGVCDADCSLREAITAANADVGAETITFAPEVIGSIVLGTALPDLTGPMTIQGPGANLLTVIRDVDAVDLFRIFTTATSGAINISGLTISGGRIEAPGGGGIFNEGAQLTLTNVVVSNNTALTTSGMGGGILSAGGSLKLSFTTVTGNNSGCDGGGIDVFMGTATIENSTISNNTSGIGGGGIFSFGSSLTITASTLNDNTAADDGGGIYNFGTLEITNSTFSGNIATSASGGGIYNSGGALTLTSSTFSSNTATNGSGGGIYNNDSGGTTDLRNTIIANNIADTDPDLSGTFNSLDYNLIETPGGATISGTTTHNITGQDPNLGPLANYGGPTRTHSLLEGSPAIDAGDSSGLNTDQRGFDRPVDTDSVPNVSDGSDIGSFEVQNQSPNQPPVNTVPGPQVTDEDTDLVFSFDNGNQIKISDPDAELNPVQVTLTATNGTITLASVEDLVFTVGGAPNSPTMTFTGNIEAINAALNGLIFTPAPNFHGAASLQITTNDQGNTGSGGALSDTDTINITVNSVYDPPVANGDAYSVNEDATLNVPAPGVLSNDTGDGTLTAILVSNALGGSLTFNANGSFTYTPAANFNGTDSFTYKVNDGTMDSNVATVFITVNPISDTPQAVNDAYNTNEDTALNVPAPGVLSNDTDADNNPLTAALVSSPASGTLTFNANGSFTYTPAANFNGSDSFTYRANDGTANSNTATVTITVNAINDAPQAVNDAYSTNENTALNVAAPGVLSNDTDVDNNPLTAILVSNPASGTLSLSANGSFTYTPNAGFSGADSFTYKVNDGTVDGNTATVSLTVREGGALAFNSATYTVSEDGGSATITVNRTGGSNGEARVDYATSNGTASAGSDYTASSGTLIFADGVTTRTFTVPINEDSVDEPDETVTLTLSNPAGTGSLASPASATLTITDNDLTPATVQFDSSAYSIQEDCTARAVTVTRTGDISGTTIVDYFSTDGSAQQRTDFTIALGTLTFAPGETSKTFNILINEDSRVEGIETAIITLTNPVGGTLGGQNTATLEILDDAVESSTNAIDDSAVFICQHYHDFLDREPETEGFTYWKNILDGCGADLECQNRVRVEISSRFFIELEFQRTGFFVMRLYQASFAQPPTYLEFMEDRRLVQNSVESQKQFAALFVQRPAFLAEYPLSLTPAEFVQKLYDKAGVADPAARAAAVEGLTNNTKTRADVLFELVEREDFQLKEARPAFVRMQYFGYLRREVEMEGYNYWIDVITNRSPDNYRSMICAFINSSEYQFRFGSVRGKFDELDCNW